MPSRGALTTNHPNMCIFAHNYYQY